MSKPSRAELGITKQIEQSRAQVNQISNKVERSDRAELSPSKNSGLAVCTKVGGFLDQCQMVSPNIFTVLETIGPLESQHLSYFSFFSSKLVWVYFWSVFEPRLPGPCRLWAKPGWARQNNLGWHELSSERYSLDWTELTRNMLQRTGVQIFLQYNNNKLVTERVKSVSFRKCFTGVEVLMYSVV